MAQRNQNAHANPSISSTFVVGVVGALLAGAGYVWWQKKQDGEGMTLDGDLILEDFDMPMPSGPKKPKRVGKKKKGKKKGKK